MVQNLGKKANVKGNEWTEFLYLCIFKRMYEKVLLDKTTEVHRLKSGVIYQNFLSFFISYSKVLLFQKGKYYLICPRIQNNN